MVITTALAVEFEGFNPGAEIWGGTQANFVLRRPGHHGKEVAVVLNAPAAEFLARALGREDSPAFREEAARRLGQALLERLTAASEHVESVVFISRPLLEADAALVAALR
jgi:hypothetical protein